ncbi:hypothetical protein H8B02_15855 [Bradyrhizobium sp. Pear77]|uniref:hypothetical protein n=1 Tax=Bradyrhizobium altum TaxID=1571202 RepID=UPI001E308CC8|nr:hypothetical protein [Bradyrhizobium altum]MCC8954859.1 hypothetical protein [Bradyrhizobium altum]
MTVTEIANTTSALARLQRSGIVAPLIFASITISRAAIGVMPDPDLPARPRQYLRMSARSQHRQS